MRPVRIGSLVSLGFVAAAFGAEVAHAAELRVVAEPNTVVEGESVQLRIETELPFSTVVFDPQFDAPDFDRLGTSGQGVNVTYAGGDPSEAQKTVFYSYVLSPKRTGRLAIRNIRLRTGKGELSAPDVTVTVEKDSGGQAARRKQQQQQQRRRRNPFPNMPGFPQLPGFPPGFPKIPNIPGLFDDDDNFLPPGMTGDDEEDGGNPAAPGYQGGNAPAAPGAGRLGRLSNRDFPERLNSDFTVHAALSKRRAYVGEPIVVEYSLFDFGGLRQVEVQKWPVFTNFWKEDLEIATRFDFEDVYVRNQLARRAFLGRYAIYGLKPGKFNLDKLTIKGQYMQTSASGFGYGLQSSVHASQDETLEILPLPTEGRPEKFTGAVGKFSLKLDADKNTVLQNTPVTFTVTVSGAGNFQSIDAVKLALPPDFEVYEANTGARGVAPLGVRRELETSKTFTYTAIPRKAGKFTIDPVHWNYFDPETEKYVELKSQPVEITVAENAAGANQGANTYLQPGGGGGSVPAPGAGEIRGLKELVTAERGGGFAWWLRAALVILAGVNAYLLYRFVESRAGKFLGRFLEDPFATAKGELAEAFRAKGTAWMGPLENALYAAMEVLLGTNPRGIPRAEVQELWTERGLPPALYTRVAAVLDRVDQQRFGAGSGKDAGKARAELLGEANKLLGEMGRARKRSG